MKDIKALLKKKTTANNSESSMWDQLVDKILDGDVIPVIGENIVLDQKQLSEQDLEGPLSKIIIGALAGDDVKSNPQSYSELIYDKDFPGDKDNIYGNIKELISEVAPELQPSSLLQRLLSIKQFPFIITTTIDPIIENTMREIWKNRGRDIRTIVFNNNQMPKGMESVSDLRSEAEAEIPTIYYMFGKAETSRAHSFVVTDEDMLHFCQSWLTEGRRPTVLSRVLGNKCLLFLGCSYPDWLIRFIWFSMRSDKKENKLEKSGMFVNESIEESLASFMDRVKVYTQRDPEKVIDEIESRINEKVKKLNENRFGQPQKNTEIFLSYSRKDGEYAQKLYEALSAAGLDVWYDRENLMAGDEWKLKVRDAIRSTKFFVALLSNSMAVQVNESKAYRKEWTMAIEHASGMGSNRGFIVPIRIDDMHFSDPSLDLPEELKSHQAIAISSSSDESYKIAATQILQMVNNLSKR